MYKKRGQATIIILLGIIVFSLIVGVYYSRDYVFKSRWERLSEASLVVPQKAESVSDYVSSCVDQVSEEAIDFVGQRGGYVNVPAEVVPPGPYNKFSNSLNVISDLRVPYWYYKAANNVDKLQILNLEQIQNNIVKYVNENLRICVGSFEGFKNRGYKINPGFIKTDVEIQNDKVLFEIKFPIHMEIEDFKFDFNSFYYKSNKPLGELYDIAKGIFNYENGKLILEEKTVDMMVGYEEIPLTGESVECGFIPIWSKYEVINNFKDFLTYNIPSFKIKDSNYELKSSDRDYFEIDIGDVGSDLNINFMYSKNWPFELEVMPENGGVMKANSITNSMGRIKSVVESILCYSTWHFVYSIKYPILITLNKDDYTFQFAHMVVIDRNLPRQNLIPLPETPETDKRFCNNKISDLDVSIYDQYGSNVNDLDLKFKCINHLSDIGTTSGNRFNSKVMPCVNGFVIANKEGYHPGKVRVNSLEESGSVTVEMYKYKELNVDVAVMRGGAGEVKEDETAYITLTSEDYGASVVYPGKSKIKLIPGNYNVDLFLMRDSEAGLIIPSKEIEICVEVPEQGFSAVFGETKEECVTTKMPEIELERVIVGAVNFDMRVTDNDLNKNKVTFYVPYQGVPQSHEDLSKLTTEVDQNYVYPKFN